MIVRPTAPDADVLAPYQEGYLDVVGLCGAFNATNHCGGSVEHLWGEVGVPADGVVVLAQGRTLRVPTTRAIVDHDAYAEGTETVLGWGDVIVVDQGCNERHVTNVHQDLFNRAPDPAGRRARRGHHRRHHRE